MKPNKRDCIIQVRTTKKEKERIKKLAKKVQLTLSDYVRMKSLE